ncbi:hypothetical protein [Paractinoplanes rishiriensis]|uniref:Uncharacterized protein n=1 Tax=Paractinoplanes rishiriensis TaxID=1050105 RepID=A0A919K9H8_9ACTN|nr:hypothetical protein [Actinoplanes rishiriensis]GIF01173.1 hypothetical protein Ari01nite_86370 [Actinoplanes rishiriensis]
MTRPDRRRLRHGVRRLAVRTLFAAVLLSMAACGDDPARHDGDHVISGDLAGDREQATFLMTAGADVIRVRAHDLDGELYRISTPEDSKVLPTAVLDDEVLTTSLTDGPGSGLAIVTAELNAAVRWTIRLHGGAKEQLLDLSAGKVARVDFVAGTSRAELFLPPPSGAVAIGLAGGAGEFRIHLPKHVPARVRIGGGAGTADIDGERHTGIAGGTVLTTDSWTDAGDRYDIDLTAGVSHLSLDRQPNDSPSVASR